MAPDPGSVPLGPSPAELFQRFDTGGHYKVALSFRHSAGRLSTQTRVAVTDEASRRRFGRYWVLIRLPSGLLRWEWLNGARRRLDTGGVAPNHGQAETPAGNPPARDWRTES